MGSGKSLALDELYDMRYNLTLDLYRRRSRAYVVEVLTKSGLDEMYHPALIFAANWAGSLAFKLDPYWQTAKLDRRANVVPYRRTLVPSIFPVQVVTFQRQQKFLTIPSRLIYSTWERRLESNSANAVFVGGQWGIYPALDTSSSTSGVHNDVTQSACWGFLNDTTDTSRNPKKKGPSSDPKGRTAILKGEREKPPKPSNQMAKRNHQGEFELYVPRFTTDHAYLHKNAVSHVFQRQAVHGPGGADLWSFDHSYDVYNEGFPGPSASVSRAGVDSYAVTEKANALSVMTKNCDRLVQQSLPGRRYYNLLYQIGELKDLTTTLRGTLAIWIELERLIGRKVFKSLLTKTPILSEETRNRILQYAYRLNLNLRPDQVLADFYLNFRFGWQSMVSAYEKLAKSPERVGKEINLLIAANGKNVTLRSSFRYSEPVTTFPSITFYKTLRALNDVLVPAKSVGIRNVEVRCVVNSGLNLPRIDLPSLRKNLFNEKMGATPTPGDIYELLPWTWLIDWVFGAGDYISLMDAVNGQRNLFNYGLITYVSHTQVNASWQNYWDNSSRTQIFPPGGQPSVISRTYLNRSAKFEAKYQLRKDVAAFAGMADYSGEGATPYQKSILGALFSKYAKNPGRR